MARILFTWELGAGIGHVTRLYPIVKVLVDRGHEVIFASADLLAAHLFFAELGITILQAPICPSPCYQVKTPFTFTHLLFNCGFAEKDNLSARMRGWLDLFSLVRPDLIVADHSPGALIAARAQSRIIAALGTGFECPPNECPLRNLRSGLNPDPAQIERIEHSTLENMNCVLGTHGAPPLRRVAALYSDVAEQFLMTFRELDPYHERRSTRYCGTTWQSGGKSPEWPGQDGARIFVYLKPDAGLGVLLENISRERCSTIAYCNRLPPDFHPERMSSRLRIEHEPLNLDQVTRDCDLGVISGGHGATTSFLLNGKPVLIVPAVLEQVLTGERVERMGAGLSAPLKSSRNLFDALDRLRMDNKFRKSAQAFAKKYNQHNSPACAAGIATRCEQIIRGC